MGERDRIKGQLLKIRRRPMNINKNSLSEMNLAYPIGKLIRIIMYFVSEFLNTFTIQCLYFVKTPQIVSPVSENSCPAISPKNSAILKPIGCISDNSFSLVK